MKMIETRALCVALCLAVPFGVPAAAQQADTDADQPGPMIQVTGQGDVSVAPDLARITLGVAQDAKTAADATSGMSAAMQAVLNQLEEAGVATGDIQTSGLRLDVQRNYNDTTGEQRVIGYVATTDVTVSVRALDRLGAVLDAVVRDGANQISGLSFDVQDRKPHLDAARRAAVADARDKAMLYAQAADVVLGPVRMISEGGAGGSVPSPLMRMSMEDASAVSVAEGEITISASVSIVYDLD